LGGITLVSCDDLGNKTNDIAFLNGQPYATNRFIYDQNGLLLSQVDPVGNSKSATFNEYGQVTTLTDSRNNTSTNSYDSATGSLLWTRDSLGRSVTNFYDGNGLWVGSCDATGTRTTNYYDNVGNKTSSAAVTASGIMLATNSFAYDLNGNRTNSTSWRNVNGSWIGATTVYVFDAANRLLQTMDPDGTNSAIYSLTGKPLTTTDKLGRTTRYDYDFQDRLLRTTYPDLTAETSAFDAMGNQTNSVDQAGRVTTYVYDGLHRVVQIIDPDNLADRTEHDDLGRAKFTVDSRGITNAFGYDLAGRLVAVTNGWGTVSAVTSLYGLDANGNEVYFTNALGRVTTNVFDAVNRLVQVLSPDGTRMSAGFDIAGRRVAETNQDSVVTMYAFYGGRLATVTNAAATPDETVTRYVYDENGTLLRQVDALGRTNLFANDFDGRRTAHWMPDASLAERFAYDSVGNLVYYTNFNGSVITNQYDSMNRLTNQTSVNGYKVCFAYNTLDQRTNMTDASGTTSYAYDNQGRLTNKVVSWTGGPTISLNYRFDANENLTHLWSSSSGGVTNFYQYDSLDRLTNVLANSSAAASCGFDAVGNFQSLRYGNGVTNQSQYDSLNRLTNMVWKLNANTLGTFSYQLGLTGNRTNLSETVNGTSRTYSWTFDSLCRLRQEALGGGTSGTLSYSFDPVGNRTNRTVTGGLSLTNQTFTFNANDWLTSDGYDNNGNTTISAGNSYQFDALNHLTNMNSGAVLITYNGDGARVKKTVGGVTTYYLVDNQNPSGNAQVLEEWTVSGGVTNLSRVYNYGRQLISQRQPGVGTNYFAFDGRGSTRVLTDAGGNVVNAFAFDAYGNLIASNAAPQTVYLYCGQQWDPDLGMYYNRARYYQPGIARFWTMDPQDGSIKDPSSLNRYTYCANDPVNWSDNTGEAPDPWGHHIIPRSCWELGRDIEFGFGEVARGFFHSEEARITDIPTHNNTRPHQAYNDLVREEIRKFLDQTGMKARDMTKEEARMLLNHVKKHKAVAGYLSVVRGGPKEITKWLYEKGGWKLFPQHLQARALGKAAAAKMAKRLGGAAARKIPLIGLGFTILMAEQMHAQGYSAAEIEKAVIDDLLYNVPGMAEAGANAIWNQADYIAKGAMDNAFGYITLDYETEDLNGANGLITSDAAVDAILRRQNVSGETVTAGSLIGGW
jgi:RHS repeat-associated protein